ncbi:Sporulation domain protein [Chloroherpeton thalassium ATCC 35110]|uniref:Sporulation domain protein n=2 Tax=Chloroherpeton thalassium TaxID=100716 RepID=B3QY01_CHLT3|nr:Sporulation domain protein [Chloroherpeton thalassium ATCC 35110]
MTELILKSATTGNFEALEKLKSLSLEKDEEMMLNALLEEDGQVAVAMYKQFLIIYPNSSLGSLSRARIMEYNTALKDEQAELVPAPEKSEQKPATPEVRYTLQFGSFSTEENAARFAQKFPRNVPVKIIKVTDDFGRVSHKVRWDGYTVTREAIDRFAEKVPFDSFVVEDN